MQNVGKWAFIVGLIIAIIGGIGLVEMSWIPWLLAILGVVVGLLNVTGSETQGFLLAAVAFLVTANSLQQVPYIGEALTGVLAAVAAFVGGAALVVALKSLFATARD